MENKAFQIVANFKFKPGHTIGFLELLNEVIEQVRKEKTFVNVKVLKNQDNPDNIVLYETWLDRNDFENVQVKREYRQKLFARLPEIVAEPQTFGFWEIIKEVKK